MSFAHASSGPTAAELVRQSASANVPQQFLVGRRDKGRELLTSVAIQERSSLKIATWRTRLDHAPKIPVDSHLFVIHLGGAPVHRMDRSEAAHLPGAFSFLPGPESSTWSSSGTVEFAHFYLSAALVSGIAEALYGRALGDGELFSSPAVQSGRLQRLLAAAVETVVGDGPVSQMQLDAWALILGEAALKHFSGFAAVPPPAKQPSGLSQTAQRRVFEYVEAHLESPVGLADMAEAAGMSPYHFARCFKISTGMTPHHFVVQQRVERAKHLLGASELSLAQIAFACGFSSQSHMTTVFKRVTGHTPARFRKAASC